MEIYPCEVQVKIIIGKFIFLKILFSKITKVNAILNIDPLTVV